MLHEFGHMLGIKEFYKIKNMCKQNLFEANPVMCFPASTKLTEEDKSSSKNAFKRTL